MFGVEAGLRQRWIVARTESEESTLPAGRGQRGTTGSSTAQKPSTCKLRDRRGPGLLRPCGPDRCVFVADYLPACLAPCCKTGAGSVVSACTREQQGPFPRCTQGGVHFFSGDPEDPGSQHRTTKSPTMIIGGCSMLSPTPRSDDLR